MKLLNVGTWNIYNGLPYGFSLSSDLKRINKIIYNLENENLDIIGLQELNNLTVLNYIKNRLEDKYKFFYYEKNIFISNIFLFIFLFLTYYFVKDIILLCFMFLFINFILRNTTIYNFLMQDIKSGLVILINKKIYNDNYSLEYNSFKSQKEDILNLISNRGYLKLKIKLNDKDKLIIYNTHLNCTYDESQERTKQIKELFEDSKNNEKDDKQIILGNLNTKFNELNIIKEDFYDSLENSNLNTWDLKNPYTDTLLCKDSKLKKEGRVDYIFYKNLKKKSSNIIFNLSKYLSSDHYGVKAIFKLKLPNKKSI